MNFYQAYCISLYLQTFLQMCNLPVKVVCRANAEYMSPSGKCVWFLLVLFVCYLILRIEPKALDMIANTTLFLASNVKILCLNFFFLFEELFSYFFFQVAVLNLIMKNHVYKLWSEVFNWIVKDMWCQNSLVLFIGLSLSENPLSHLWTWLLFVWFTF